MRLTEGELKADICQALTGLPTLSVPGVGNWKPALDKLKAAGAKPVRLAFDADAADKPAVARPLAACADTLINAGYAVELERWAKEDGKGLDDLLAAGKTPELLQGDAALQAVREWLAEATAILAELQPTTAMEAMLAAQMIGAQRVAMTFLSSSLIPGQTAEAVDAHILRATRLMRLFNEQVETMEKLKGKPGQRRVVVEHVTVAAGGQAIVGVANRLRRGEGPGDV